VRTQRTTLSPSWLNVPLKHAPLPAGAKSPSQQPDTSSDYQRKDRQNWVIFFNIMNTGPRFRCNDQCRDSSCGPEDCLASAHSVPRNLAQVTFCHLAVTIMRKWFAEMNSPQSGWPRIFAQFSSRLFWPSATKSNINCEFNGLLNVRMGAMGYPQPYYI
jgi:hypothetical protein